MKKAFNKLKILHLEDVASDALLVQNKLKESKLDCEILVVDTKNNFIKALEDFGPDVVLSNSVLPSINAHEALIHLKKTIPAIPFIVVTATMSDEFAAGMFLNGADDYIAKARLNRLPASIDNALEKFRLEKEQQKLLENLVEKENRRIALVANSADGLVILNAAGEFSYVSPSIKHILGYTEEEIIQIGLPALSHPDDMLALGKVMETVLANPGVPMAGHTGRILHKNGTWRWVEATVTNLLHDPAINGIVDNFRDITERKLAEEKMIQANRLYAFISSINQTIVHASDEETVFKKVCRIACDIGKFKAAWIGMIHEKQQTVNLVESCGILAKDLSFLVNYHYDENGPHAHIVKTGTYYVSNNVQEDSVLDDWKQFYARRKIGSSIFFPIKKAGKIIGSFNLLATEVDAFTPEEIALLEEAAIDISFSLTVFEKEKLKLGADEELRNALADVNKIMDSSLDMICTVSAEGKFIKVSAASQLVLGYTPEELIGSNFMTYLYHEDADISLQAAEKIASGIPIPIFENRYMHKSGRIVPILWSINWDEKLEVMFCIAKDITEKKRLEKGIENERDRFSAMFLNAPASVAVLKGPDHIFQMANELYLILSDRKNVVGKTIREVFPEIENQGLLEVLDHVYKTGETFIAKERVVKLKVAGSDELKEVCCNFVYQVYHNGQNEIEGIFVFATDITEQQKDKENLIETSERLRLATKSAKMAIWDWDIVNSRMTCDDRMYELFGIEKQGVTGAVYNWQKQVHPDDIERMYKEVNDAITGIRDLNLEFRVVWPDTSVHFLESHAMVSRDEAGAGVRMIGINVDITERKAAEEKLVKLNEEVAKSEKFFKGVIENSDDMITIVDTTGHTIYASPAVSKKFGYTNEECLNINIADIAHPDDALIMQEFLIKVMMNPGMPMECPVIRNLKKDGTYMWVDGTLTNFLETEGINAIVANFRDITEKKKLEDLLDKSNRLAAIGSWEIDVSKGTVFWSAITKEIREAEPDFVPDLSTGMQLFEEGTHKSTIKKRVQDCIEKGVSWDEELQIITQKGNLKWVRTIGEGEFLNEKCIRVYGSFQDIDTRKKAEIDVLKVYEEKNIILESIGDAFFAVDKNWMVTYWNNQAEKILQTPKIKYLVRIYGKFMKAVKIQNLI